jgi:CubicO group peptidase (beta-lactamase class C family)
MSKRVISGYLSAVIVLVAIAIQPAAGQGNLTADLVAKIDKLAGDVLTRTGVPSASIAVVKDGRIALVKAYGRARLDPQTPAKPEMRYGIGSISKQFTAAAILLLQEEGKLSLDDKVSRFMPDLTRAAEVSIRQLLSHTSGYQDYWPQDYVMPMMLEPVERTRLLDTWARKPLDFEPGTKWQYSNTNYVIAGSIAEKAAGKPLLDYLREKVFVPLGVKNVVDIDAERLASTDPTGYMRYALGPLRPAPKEGKGWLFAAGELAMTAEDLAKWDIALINRTLLKPESYRQLETEVLLKNGSSTRYGLGVSVASTGGHRSVSHSGEVSGFTAQNIVMPDDGIAVVVLTNQDATSASGSIAQGIVPLLLETDDPQTPRKLERARKIFADLQRGTIDRSLFTDNANAYFTPQALKDFAQGLGRLGTPQDFLQTSESLRGGMVFRSYFIRFGDTRLGLTTFEMPDGKLEQYQIAPLN